MKITIERLVKAPVEAVWNEWTTAEDIRQCNAASDDWHTVRASVDLRVGGAFSSRMEARDGSMGFDFAGTYTRVVPQQRIEASFGDRVLIVEFDAVPGGVTVRETFDAESTHPIEQQRAGWQAILDNFARHVEAKIDHGSSSPSRTVTIQATPSALSIDLAAAAVLVVDMQNDFGAEGGMFHRGAQAPRRRAPDRHRLHDKHLCGVDDSRCNVSRLFVRVAGRLHGRTHRRWVAQEQPRGFPFDDPGPVWLDVDIRKIHPCT